MLVYEKKGEMAVALTYLNEAEQLLVKVNKMVNLTRLIMNMLRNGTYRNAEFYGNFFIQKSF